MDLSILLETYFNSGCMHIMGYSLYSLNSLRLLEIIYEGVKWSVLMLSC